jgi:hypothetical protein
MYHDQALIPIKTLAFDEGVNVTLGLPFIRTSPDHGTAFDIAGTGRANPTSLIAALEMAADMANARTARAMSAPSPLHPGEKLPPEATAPVRGFTPRDGASPPRHGHAAHERHRHPAPPAPGHRHPRALRAQGAWAELPSRPQPHRQDRAGGGDLTGSDVLEVGPGPGGLTRGLLAEGARRVVAVEKDARCLPALAEIAAAYPGRLEVIHGDALDLDWAAHLASPVRIVANLPYNVGTELLVRWLTPEAWPPLWSSMTLMFQREVAERIVAQPGSKAYGRLAILAQWRTTARIAMTLPPEAFTPPPKVRSAVVHLDALPEPRFPADPQGC